MCRKVCPNDHWFICIWDHFDYRESIGDKTDVHAQKALTAASNKFPWITRHFPNLTKDTLFNAKNFSSLHVRTLIPLGTVTAFHSPHLEGDRWWVTGGRSWTIFPKTLFTQIWKENWEIMPHSVTCENSHLSWFHTARNVSQATRCVSNQNGKCKARHMARV